jgi:hypothetical protein
VSKRIHDPSNQKEKSINPYSRRKKDYHQFIRKDHSTKKIATKEPEDIDEDGFTLVTKKNTARGIPNTTYTTTSRSRCAK